MQVAYDREPSDGFCYELYMRDPWSHHLSEPGPPVPMLWATISRWPHAPRRALLPGEEYAEEETLADGCMPNPCSLTGGDSRTLIFGQQQELNAYLHALPWAFFAPRYEAVFETLAVGDLRQLIVALLRSGPFEPDGPDVYRQLAEYMEGR